MQSSTTFVNAIPLPVHRLKFAAATNLSSVRLHKRARHHKRPVLAQISPDIPPDPRIPEALQPEEVIGNYRVSQPLGSGSSAITYAAKALTGPYVGQPLALKALSLRALSSWKALDLFQREAATLQTLSHPSIPTYVDFFESDRGSDTLFILVQRQAPGASLQSLLDKGTRFTTEQIASVFTQLLSVLDYLISLNPPILHRDIKPSNVIIDVKDTKVCLVDFGGVNTGRFGNLGSTMVGTFGYMAPEAFTGTADVRSDMYAIAATILCILTRQQPSALPQKRLKIDLESIIPARERLKLGNVYTVMQRLLEPAPEDRYDSPATALAALTATGKYAATKPLSNALGMRPATLSDAEAESLNAALANVSEVSGDRRNGAFEMFSDWAGGRARRRKPVGTRVVVERDRNSKLLRIIVPPRGFSGDTLSRGAFTVAWTGFTAFWTVGVITGGAPLVISLVSLPFWVTSVKLARSTAEDIVGGATLVISFGGGEREIFYFAIRLKGIFGNDTLIEGDARDLDRALIETEMYVNGRPVTELVISEGTRRHVFGGGLEPVEQEWVRDEINNFLSSRRS